MSNITTTIDDLDVSIDDDLLKLLVPIIGVGLYMVKETFNATLTKYFPNYKLGQNGNNGGNNDDDDNDDDDYDYENNRNRDYNYKQYERDEDVDVVLDSLWEPPGVKDMNRFTRINDSRIIIAVPPGELEEINKDKGKDKDSSSHNKGIPKSKDKKIISYHFETKETGDNYANCDGTYTLKEGLINKKPIYINKEKDRFLGAIGPSGWCITAMQYLDGIQEMKSGPFGGFHSGGGVLPDYGTWPNYNVSIINNEEGEREEEEDILVPKETVQGSVNVFREFNDKPDGGIYYFEIELKSVTQGMVKLFVKRFDKDYNFVEKYGHEYKKAKNGFNTFEIKSKIGEHGIEYEQIGVIVYSAEINQKNKKKMNNTHSDSRCIITRAYLKDRPRYTKNT